jgi:hypothetical protein
MPAHLSIDAKYIDINIHELYDPGGNLMITTSAPAAVSRKGRPIGLWILSGLVAAVFIGAGGAKSAGAVVMEVTGGLGLLMSLWAFQSAVLLAVVMVGAFIAHITVLGGSPAARSCCSSSPGSSPTCESRSVDQERSKS